MSGAQPPKGSASDSDDKDVPERNPSPALEDQLEYDDISTTTSTSSDWMGPPHGHKIIDPIEYNFGIFARAKEEGKLDLVLKHYGMTEEDLYPWKKKYRKLQNSKGQQKKPTPKRPATEEEGNKRKQRPKSDSSSDEMMGANPKNFDYYFGGKKKEEGKMDSKEERQRQTDHDNNPNSKGKDKQNTDTTHAQVVRVENIAPILQPFIPSQQETVQVPEQPEYVPLPNSAKILASEAKVRDWLKSSTPPVSVISNDVPRLNEPPNKGEPLFGYNVGYYVTAAAAAGLAALIGAGVYAWQGRKRSSKDDKDEEAKVGTKGSRRLHARDWRLVGDD